MREEVLELLLVLWEVPFITSGEGPPFERMPNCLYYLRPESGNSDIWEQGPVGVGLLSAKSCAKCLICVISLDFQNDLLYGASSGSYPKMHGA